MAVITLVRKFLPNKSKPQGGCGQGCGCEMTKTSTKKL